jgi:hypothetical protein
MKRLDDLVHSIQADPQHTKLLQILGLQLERLVSNGWPDFCDFITRLTSGGLISEDEARELRITFPLEDVSDLNHHYQHSSINKTTKGSSSRWQTGYCH